MVPNLGDDIVKKTSRVDKMLQRFARDKDRKGAIRFDEVDISRRSTKEGKGDIVPSINYISDEGEDGKDR